MNNLWIGTTNSGLYKFNYKKDTFTRYINLKDNPNSPNGNEIWSLYLSDDNKLWMGVFGIGMDCLDLNTNQWKHYKIDPDNKKYLSQNVWWMAKATKHKLWIGTNGG